MESKPKSEIDLILEQIIETKEYNQFMQALFIEISQKKLFFLENTKFKKEDLIKNMKKNIKILIEYIDKLDETKNIDIYRCLSCIYGAFLGDAEGGYCEFKKPDKDNFKKVFRGNPIFGEDPGQITDDSEMAIASAFGLMDNPELLDINNDYLFYYYGLWHTSKPRDEGISTRKALMHFKASNFDPNKSNNYEDCFKKIIVNNAKTLANGFLMRTSPLIVWIYYRFNEKVIKTFSNEDNSKDLFELFSLIRDLARKDNICTHPNESLSVSRSLFCIMALAAICGLKPLQILNSIKNLLTTNDIFKQKEFLDITNMILGELDIYEKNKEKFKKFDNCFIYFTQGNKNVYSHMGFYFHAFRLTLYYLFFFDEITEDKSTTKFRTIMNQICNFGGDTDTNAAIVGTVIGPIIGYKNFGKDDFHKMAKLVPLKRYIYSPGLMVIFVHFLKDNINNNKVFKPYFLKMLLTILYEKIDVNNIKQIFEN